MYRQADGVLCVDGAKLMNPIRSLLNYWAALKANPYAEEFRPSHSFAVEPPETPFHIAMPGKYRPHILESFRNEQEAVSALEIEAAALSAAGWLVYRVHDGLWHISLDGDLNTRL